jgi:hypothetical protein
MQDEDQLARPDHTTAAMQRIRGQGNSAHHACRIRGRSAPDRLGIRARDILQLRKKKRHDGACGSRDDIQDRSIGNWWGEAENK